MRFDQTVQSLENYRTRKNTYRYVHVTILFYLVFYENEVQNLSSGQLILYVRNRVDSPQNLSSIDASLSKPLKEGAICNITRRNQISREVQPFPVRLHQFVSLQTSFRVCRLHRGAYFLFVTILPY